jgi:hypothetical protein
MYWLLGRQSHLSTSNKLLYKTILKPIWTYGIQLWGTASTSNIKILERFQSKTLSMIVDAPWYVPTCSSKGIFTVPQLQKKSAASALTMVLASAPIISQQTFLGSLSTDAYTGICLMICLPDSNLPFLIVIFSS